MLNVGPPPVAVAHVAPLLTVANAAPLPSRLFVLPVDVVTKKAGPPDPTEKSIVPATDRLIAPAASINEPPPADDATTSVAPKAIPVPDGMDCVTGVPVLATRLRTPPLSVSGPPPSFNAVL